LEKAQKTRSDPNFCKTAIAETRKNKKFGKSRLSQGLILNLCASQVSLHSIQNKKVSKKFVYTSNTSSVSER